MVQKKSTTHFVRIAADCIIGRQVRRSYNNDGCKDYDPGMDAGPGGGSMGRIRGARDG